MIKNRFAISPNKRNGLCCIAVIDFIWWKNNQDDVLSWIDESGIYAMYYHQDMLLEFGKAGDVDWFLMTWDYQS